MQRAVYSGELSVADYYERQSELRMAESNGVDDGSSCSKGIFVFCGSKGAMYYFVVYFYIFVVGFITT